MYLVCDPGPPVVLRMLGGSNVTNLSIEEGTLDVLNWVDPSIDFNGTYYPLMYSLSGEWGGVVLKWAVDNLTCENAMASKVVYRCASSYSDCVDVTDDAMRRQLGYRCKCSQGFGGNPYIKDGCTGTVSARFEADIMQPLLICNDQRVVVCNLQISTSVRSRINTYVMVYAKILLETIRVPAVLVEQISTWVQGNATLPL